MTSALEILTKYNNTTNNNTEEKTMTTKASKPATKPVAPTTAKKPAAQAKTTAATKTPTTAPKKSAADVNVLGHRIGSQADVIDNLLLAGKSTGEQVNKAIMKKFGLDEKKSAARVKAHIKHLEAVKKCKVNVNSKTHVITCKKAA